ncbi:DinB family protein, partial [Acinetobacter baumannii]
MTCEEFLDDVIRRYGNLRDRAETTLNGLTEDQFNKPIEGFHWTLAQICEHVLLSHGLYIAIIAEGMDRRKPAPGAEVRFSFIGRR